MADLIMLVNKYFEECKIALAERYSPYFTMSVVAHLLNIENQQRSFLVHQNKTANLRVHIFMCAPPGHMKTVLLRSFLDGELSICGIADIDAQFEGSMCLPAGTKIRLAGSKCINIENIEDVIPGNEVISYNVDEGHFYRNTVTETHKMKGRLLSIRTRDGRNLKLTGNHPVLLREIMNWREAKYLKIRDELLVYDVDIGKVNVDKIIEIEQIEGIHDVYNLTVENDHNYIANDIITHNTEAAFTGTIKYIDGEPIQVKGAAYEHKEGIVGIDEFAVLSNSMKQDHSVNLDNALLTALDSGFLVKRLALGKIQYITQMTLMTGSQPARFVLTGGLGRRLVFVFFVPTAKESRLIKLARRQGRNAKAQPETIRGILNTLKSIVASMEVIENVEFGKSLYDFLDELDVPHFEEELYERMALAYTVAKKGHAVVNIQVEMDERLRAYFKKEHQWRQSISQGADIAQVWSVVQEMEGATKAEIKTRLNVIGLTWEDSTTRLQLLRRYGKIDWVKPDKLGRGKKKEVLVLLEDEPEEEEGT